MEKCIDCLIKNGYELIVREDKIHAIFRKLIDGNEFHLLLVGPHEGNDYGYLLRGDFVEMHDRWTNADYDRFFNNEEDFLKNWNRFWFFDEF